MQTPITREPAVHVLHGINKYLNDCGVHGDTRGTTALHMMRIVEHARNCGLHYDGGPWADFAKAAQEVTGESVSH